MTAATSFMAKYPRIKAVNSFMAKYRCLHIWFFTDFLLLAAYVICRRNRAWMNALTRHFTLPLQQISGRLCSHVSVSVMEILAALLVLTATGYLIGNVIFIARTNPPRRGYIYTAFMRAVCAGLSLEVLFCLMWGVNFRADGFQEQSGFYARPVSDENLYAVTVYFAQNLSIAADHVPRDENGLFAVSRADILHDAPDIYDPTEKIYPFLTFDDIGVKPMFFSRLMSRMNFTGFYFSCTGEANVNVDSPACLLPATVAHEMTHQRGIASEQECNFLAVLACVNSENPAYIYAGWLDGYIYLSNALWKSNPDAYREIYAALPQTVRTDLADNSAYWDQFRDGVVKTVSTTVYDGILKSYGDNRGIRSYGAVVDLLTAYYAPETSSLPGTSEMPENGT